MTIKLKDLPVNHLFKFPDDDEKVWQFCKVSEDHIYELRGGGLYTLNERVNNHVIIDLGMRPDKVSQ